jgi:drug/metabolite transporter (DMT)-like permease
MPEAGWLWIVFTVIAAAAQTVRNAAQRELTASLGTIGATHVRFLFGLPFAMVFLAGVSIVRNETPPWPPTIYWPWVIDGAAMQFAATVLMLAAMKERSFVVTIAYTKTEPVQVALFGLVLLGDPITWPMAAAILLATSGVMLMSLHRGASTGNLRSALFGLGAGAVFGLSAIGYRGAILSLMPGDFVMAATLTLTTGLVLQSIILTTWLWWCEPGVLVAIGRAWRPSLFAGFMGALASQFWYLAFALATAASVRTLALIEVLFAQAISRFVFKQPTRPREAMGIVLIVAGVAVLIWSS